MGVFSKEKEAAKDSEKLPPPPPAYPDGGASSSTFDRPPLPHSSGPIFPCVLLCGWDKIRILGFPNEQDIVHMMDTSIQRTWAQGIQQSGAYQGGGWEWKMKGRPWVGSGEQGTHSRRLVCSVLYELSVRGWHLLVSTGLSKKTYDKDTMIFRAGPPAQRYFFPVSFHESDKIRIIDSPNPEVSEALIQVIHTNWPLGVQSSGVKDTNSYQLKLKGNPWYTSDGVEINYVRLLMCEVLKVMDAHGFELLTSIDVNVGAQSDTITDIDTWIFASKM